MNCTSCKHPNALERNYCGACGAPLARYCALCGFRNLLTDRFCGGCGVSLEEGARPAPAEPLGGTAPTASAAATPSDDLAELLEAARDQAAAPPDDGTARVSQDDIDSLFGD